MSYKIENKIRGGLGRAGVWDTPHGAILTPAFIAVGTQATVKALAPEQVRDVGIQAVLANTYHLYLKPGVEILKRAGGIHNFMNWEGPTMTDSGGFQVFSLGVAYDTKIGKVVRKVGKGNESKRKVTKKNRNISSEEQSEDEKKVSLVKIDEDGVDFKSVIDGSLHRFTPEKSIEIQQAIGADIIFAFDECPSPNAPEHYQKEALLRTLRWGERSLKYHQKIRTLAKNTNTIASMFSQQIMGVIQGGRIEELRRKSAKESAKMEYDGFGIGGSFDKEDIGLSVCWVNEELPESKPRHLLGIGEPNDLLLAIENGCDTFDCVAPTRMGRNGALHTRKGRINIFNAEFRTDTGPIEVGCNCYTCKNYSRSYVAHLFHSREMFGATLASIHNLFFINDLVRRAREAILQNNFAEFKENNWIT